VFKKYDNPVARIAATRSAISNVKYNGKKSWINSEQAIITVTRIKMGKLTGPPPYDFQMNNAEAKE